ncbi:uncharacterized protein [Antedon mediterranea]|uniref:uncharacterized protein n=1 Tax=Antedon mediterranea TaxID=105859 RepID=UPI003AF45177
MAKSIVDARDVGVGSCSASSVGLTTVSLPQIAHHPDSWTRVTTNNMHLRSLHQIDQFQAWQSDVQSQISCISEKLRSSLEENPHPNINISTYGPEEVSFEDKRKQYTRKTTPQIQNAIAFGNGRT